MAVLGAGIVSDVSATGTASSPVKVRNRVRVQDLNLGISGSDTASAMFLGLKEDCEEGSGERLDEPEEIALRDLRSALQVQGFVFLSLIQDRICRSCFARVFLTSVFRSATSGGYLRVLCAPIFQKGIVSYP